MIKIPHDLELFNHSTQINTNWLRNDVHGLEWNSCYEDFLFNEELVDFIKKQVKVNVVLVKGTKKHGCSNF